jgi:L-asparaginase
MEPSHTRQGSAHNHAPLAGQVAAHRQTPQVVVLGTGGTIAGRASDPADHVGYTAGVVPVSELLAGVALPLGVAVRAEQVAQVDSKDMHHGVWRALLARTAALLADDAVAGVVVTHGTDTLEETAYLLHRLLRPAKPVVLTCAMRPASALVPDGPQNLADALWLAAQPGVRGVLAVCAGQVHSGLEVRKAHTWRVDAFDSGDAGALGVLEAGAWVPWRGWPEAAGPQAAALEHLLAQPTWPRVDWISNHTDADGAIVRDLLAAAQAAGASAPRGLVVAGTGNGTLNTGLEAALREAVATGWSVCVTTRCAGGRVRPPVSSAGAQRVGREQWFYSALVPSKARVALMLHLTGTGTGTGTVAAGAAVEEDLQAG